MVYGPKLSPEMTANCLQLTPKGHMQQTTILISVTESRLTELISDAVASAFRSSTPQVITPPINADGSEVLTRKELLEQLDIASSTLASWQRQGLITPRRIGRRVYFLRRDVESILHGGSDTWRSGR